MSVDFNYHGHIVSIPKRVINIGNAYAKDGIIAIATDEDGSTLAYMIERNHYMELTSFNDAFGNTWFCSRGGFFARDIHIEFTGDWDTSVRYYNTNGVAL